MEKSPMGKVIVTAKMINLQDLYDVQRGLMPPEQARSVEVTDAMVDTAATSLMAPRHVIEQLGLRPFRTRQARTAAGPITLQVYEAVRLVVQGREFTCDVAEVADDCPVLLGQIPLEGLDFLIDPQGQRLIGNPAHGGEHMIEIFSVFRQNDR
jgi:predicted aspartyl protease